MCDLLILSQQTEQLHGLVGIHINCCICALSTQEENGSFPLKYRKTHVVNSFHI